MCPLLVAVPQVVPEKVLLHLLGQPRGPQVGDVPLLIAPLHPPRLGDDRVDQNQALHSLGVSQAVPGQHVGPEPDPETDVLDDLEVVEHLLDLLSQLLHAGVLVVRRQGGGAVLLTGSVDVENGKPGGNFLNSLKIRTIHDKSTSKLTLNSGKLKNAW